MFVFSAYGQTNIVTPDSIQFECHVQNIGTIAFMDAVIPIESFSPDKWLDTFRLQPKTDLHIRVFMGNSLTNYLHALAPVLTATALTENGNYQFSFYVDEKLVYIENLPVGAGSAESKNTKTVFRVPLISVTNEDSWGRFLWQRFMMQGGADALTAGAHQFKIEIRPYVKATTILVGDIIATGTMVIVVPEQIVDARLVAIQKIQPTKEWQISTESVDTILMTALNKKIVTKQFKDITSIVVVKDNKLLMESYYNGAKRKTLHDTRSVGKTVASALTGIAIQDGYLPNEYTTLNHYYDLHSFQNYSQAKDSISIKNLLTMQSIFDGSDSDMASPGNEEKMYPTDNWVQFALNLPIDTQKITAPHWDYFTAGVVLLGDIINKSVPGGLEDYCDKQLFTPLGIKKYKWEYTPQHVGNTAGGLRLSSLDLAKIGSLYQQKGQWNGKAIFSADWAAKSLSPQIAIDESNNYGYLLWNKTYIINDKPYEVYYASGNGGNIIFIFKDYPVVIVITATAYNQGYAHIQVDKIMEHYLIPALHLE